MHSLSRTIMLSTIVACACAESAPVPPEPSGGKTLVTELPVGASMSIGVYAITTKESWAAFLNGCSETADFKYYESTGFVIPEQARSDKMVFDATTWTNYKNKGTKITKGTYTVVAVSSTYAVMQYEYAPATDGKPAIPPNTVFYFIRPDRIVKRFKSGMESVVTFTKP